MARTKELGKSVCVGKKEGMRWGDRRFIMRVRQEAVSDVGREERGLGTESNAVG